MKKILFFLVPIVFILISCKDTKSTETVTSPNGTFTLQLSNLPALDDSLVLAAWILDDAGKIIHKFGKLSYPLGSTSFVGSFPLTLSDFQANTKNQFVCISIEDRDSTLNDTTSSNVFLLISKIRTNEAQLSVVPKNPVGIAFGSDFDDQKYLSDDTSAAVPPSFKTAKGLYTVFSPTDSNANPNSGIWFLNYKSAGTYETGLRLPELPSGWTYKGWVKVNGKYLSIGEFKLAVGNDGQNPFVGVNAMPAYPGEDFLQNAPSGFTFPLDLAGQEVIITVEPNGFNGYNKSKPFPLILLKGIIPSPVSNTTSPSLENNFSNFPSGSAVYKINLY